MKAHRLRWLLLFLLGSAVFQLPAQQSEADRKVLADIRARAEKGDGQSQIELGTAFFYGRLGLAKNEAEAVKWYRKAAAQNYAGAQYNLGDCYCEGRGVRKDEAEAVKWFHKAAAQNLDAAQNRLGVCYANGRGVAKDELEAVRWYRKAAEQNHAKAQFSLGGCYCKGRGVARDYVEGCKWFLLAAGQGDEGAKRAVSVLENKMTQEQIAEGQKRARGFQPQEVPFASENAPAAGGH